MNAHSFLQYVATMSVLTAKEATLAGGNVHKDFNGMRMATVKVCKAQKPGEDHFNSRSRPKRVY